MPNTLVIKMDDKGKISPEISWEDNVIAVICPQGIKAVSKGAPESIYTAAGQAHFIFSFMRRQIMTTEGIFPINGTIVPKDKSKRPYVACKLEYENNNSFVCYKVSVTTDPIISGYFDTIEKAIAAMNSKGHNGTIYRCWLDTSANMWYEDDIVGYYSNNTYSYYSMCSPSEKKAIEKDRTVVRTAVFPLVESMPHHERYWGTGASEPEVLLQDIQREFDVLDSFIELHKDEIKARTRAFAEKMKEARLDDETYHSNDAFSSAVPSLRYMQRIYYYDSIFAANARLSEKLRKKYPFLERFNSDGTFSVKLPTRSKNLIVQKACLEIICEVAKTFPTPTWLQSEIFGLRPFHRYKIEKIISEVNKK